MSEPAPFEFRDAVRLRVATGRSVDTLAELREAVATVDESVLHHHLRETPLHFTFTLFEYPNDFALWAGQALEDHALAERLAVLDPFHERDLEALRESVLAAIDQSLRDPDAARQAPAGMELDLVSSCCVEMDLGVEAATLPELTALIERVPATSLYFHFYEARLRNEDGWDDIATWLRDTGHTAEAERVRDVDIYLLPLEGCRRVVLELLTPPAPAESAAAAAAASAPAASAAE